MPIPIQAAQARLIIGDVSYALTDLHVSTAESMDREELRATGGGLRGFTRGRVTSRVTIDAELMPTPEPLTDQQLRERIYAAQHGREPRLATGSALDALASQYGVTREPLTGQRQTLAGFMDIVTERLAQEPYPERGPRS